MSTKRFKELKNLSQGELTTKLRELELELFQGKMKQTTGQLEDTSKLWRLRKDMARIKMLQSATQASNTAPKAEKAAR